jgi:hypothetical protein
MSLIVAATIDKCCDPRHDLLATGNNRVVECRLQGGVAIIGVVVDESGHAFTQLTRCDFPPQIMNPHYLPQVEHNPPGTEKGL